jgi:hypothetical protein
MLLVPAQEESNPGSSTAKQERLLSWLPSSEFNLRLCSHLQTFSATAQLIDTQRLGSSSLRLGSPSPQGTLMKA